MVFSDVLACICVYITTAKLKSSCAKLSRQNSSPELRKQCLLIANCNSSTSFIRLNIVIKATIFEALHCTTSFHTLIIFCDDIQTNSGVQGMLKYLFKRRIQYEDF